MRQGSWIALLALLAIVFFAANQRGQVAWTTITVSGGSSSGGDLEATLADTLNLVAGANVTLTSTPGTDSITITAATTGSAAFTLDLSDDGTNESATLSEIATVGGGATTIFTEPSPDKLLIDTGVAWPAATALAANGANCAAGNAPLGVDASGAAEGCFDVEEETHAAEHAVGAGDEVAFYGLIDDEGTPLTGRRTLNFIGAGVSCVDDGPGAETDCTISGGGAGNSFETMDAPTGTDPVADSATDTLLFATTNSAIGITGSASADSLTFGLNNHPGTEIRENLEEEAQISATAISGNASGSSSSDSLLLGTATNVASWVSVPDCIIGAGIHINYDAIANSFICGDTEAFVTIAAGGQSSGAPIIAESAGDTLTLLATGSGSLSFNAATDTITIAMTGSLTVQDEGLDLIQRFRLNFTGAGVSCADSVGAGRTDCTISGGGAGNSFETMDAPTGTDPVADSSTDTLLLLTTNSAIGITGSSAADSLTFGLNNHPGTDIREDLEEELHATEHVTGNDILYFPREIIFGQDGDVSTTMNMENRRFTARRGGTIEDVLCRVTTAPTTSAVTIDVNLDGTTIFTTQANRPSIAAGSLSDVSGDPNVTTYSATQVFSIEIDAEDSGNTAADLVCQILVWETVSTTPSGGLPSG